MAKLVAVGYQGKVSTSEDGITWTAQTGAHGTNIIRDVAYDGRGLFVACGNSGSLSSSPDGVTWTARTSQFGSSVVFGAGFKATNADDAQWVIVGQFNKTSDSPDGVTWTLRTNAVTHSEKVAHDDGSGRWVAVGGSGEIATSDDGITWTLQSTPNTQPLYNVAHDGSGLWVVVGRDNTVWTSNDGVTWTAQTGAFDPADDIYGVCYGNGQWVAVGGGPSGVATSPDGITWTLRTGAHGGSTIREVAYHAGLALYVAVGDSGKVSTSPDGITWTARTGAHGTDTILSVTATYTRTYTYSENVTDTADSAQTLESEQISRLFETLTLNQTYAAMEIESFLTQSFDSSTSISYDLAVVIRETLEGLTTLASQSTLSVGLTEALTTIERFSIGRGVSLTDSAAFTDTLATLLNALPAITETLTELGVVSSQLQAQGLIVIAAALSDLANHGMSGNITESVDAADTFTQLIIAYGALVESLTGSDTANNTLTAVISLTDNSVIDDTPSLNQVLQALIEDGGDLFTTFQFGSEVFTGYVVNTETTGFSTYSNYPFDSFAWFNGKTYACADDGVYELTGADDQGANIDATLLTGLIDFGTSRFKRVEYAYIGYTSSGGMVLKVKAVESGQLKEHWFELTARTADAPREGVIKLARGLRSRYWQFELVNKSGSDFDLSELQLYPIILTRRV